MKIILAVMAMTFFVWWIIPSNHDYTKKPNYNKSTWLSIEGNVTKGYTPYASLTYYTWKDECRVQLDDYNMMWLLFDPVLKVLIQDYDGKKEGRLERVYMAKMRSTENYALQYPKNFFIDGCEFLLYKTFLRLREDDDSASTSEKLRYEDENDTLVLRYYVIEHQNPDRNFKPNGTYSCQEECASSDLECKHEAENRDNDFEFYQSELDLKTPFYINILVSGETENSEQ